MAAGDGIAVFPALDALVTRMEAGLARLEARLGELERLSTAKVAELTRPGPVLLWLAVGGFGVTLPDKKGDR
jgi:hypothetical protein